MEEKKIRRVRDASPDKPVGKEKDTRPIWFTVTKAEYDEVKRCVARYPYGQLSFVLRNALRKWLVEEKKRQEAEISGKKDGTT